MPEGKVPPSAVWIDGRKAESQTMLTAGVHQVVIKYDQPGRSYVVFSTKKEDEPAVRTPLAMKWFDRESVLRYSPRSEQETEQWFRFVSPPGLVGLAFPSSIRDCTVFVNGTPCKRLTDSALDYIEIPPAAQSKEASTVAIRVQNTPWGISDGAVFSEPIKLRCEKGTISLGDWSTKGVLETYSGGAWYRKTIHIDGEELDRLKAEQGRMNLDLGDVTASCEVRVNGKLAAVLTTAPWCCDITPLLTPGDNEIAVLVMNTLANHYRTIPSSYRGNPRSGLIGPVQLRKTSIAIIRWL
jgi:hypothetical protein